MKEQRTHHSLVGSLVRFKPVGNYHEFHNAVGMVTSHNKPLHVRVKWVKPVHYAIDSEHYKFHGPATVSDFGVDRVEVISSTLTDEQLEDVVGGMSPERFSNWRAEKLNESR